MHFHLKMYQILKVKNYMKNHSFFFIFHSAKLRSNEWIYIEQKLKKLKLTCYKTFNGTTIKTFDNSIFENFKTMLCGIILFVKPRFKTNTINFFQLKKEFKNFFKLISIKLNNKIYSTNLLNKLNTFSYKQNVFNFYKCFDKYLKTTHILTKITNKTKLL